MLSWLSRKSRRTPATSPAFAPRPAPRCTWSNPSASKLDDRRLKRAGLDYWPHLHWHRWPEWAAFQKQLPAGARLWLIESHGTRHYAEIEYQPDDYLVFGRETAGLPRMIIEQYPGAWLRVPMFHREVRSLNLSNCVALVLYEALRQQGFDGEI